MQVSFNFLSSFLNVLEFYSDIRNGGIELRDRASCFSNCKGKKVFLLLRKIFGICWANRAFRTVFFLRDLGAIT